MVHKSYHFPVCHQRVAMAQQPLPALAEFGPSRTWRVSRLTVRPKNTIHCGQYVSDKDIVLPQTRCGHTTAGRGGGGGEGERPDCLLRCHALPFHFFIRIIIEVQKHSRVCIYLSIHPFRMLKLSLTWKKWKYHYLSSRFCLYTY